jgi:hypothetical protein
MNYKKRCASTASQYSYFTAVNAQSAFPTACIILLEAHMFKDYVYVATSQDFVAQNNREIQKLLCDC